MTSLSFDYTAQTVIVTGAARGIGLEIGRFFADSGAVTYLVDLDEDVLEAAVGETAARCVRADVSDSADVSAVVAKVVSETGRIDVLVNNAGILRDRVLWKMTDGDWERVLAVHAGGTFRFTRECVPHFRARGYGRVVNVTSYTGLHGNIGQSNYAAAKAGIIGRRAAGRRRDVDVTTSRAD